MATCNMSYPDTLSMQRFEDAAQWAEALSVQVATLLREALSARGQASLVVSGGRTPQDFFCRLAQQPLAWEQVTVTLADERWVDASSQHSNERLVKASLLQGPAAAARFIGLSHTAESLEQAARVAEQHVAALSLPIDVLVLGMGDDGHTASLFPNSPLLPQALAQDCKERVLPMQAPDHPQQRLTLTLPLLLSARNRLLALRGQSKLDTLDKAVAADDCLAMPIRAFLKQPLTLYWCP